MGCDTTLLVKSRIDRISIHAPRVGCDRGHLSHHIPLVISIHAPRVGCDRGITVVEIPQDIFQSTHPVWGATAAIFGDFPPVFYFNPRTPCGVRPGETTPMPVSDTYFNSRTPCGVRRLGAMWEDAQNQDFNPRTPCGVRLQLLHVIQAGK